jgi:O-acetyl-ADP-ribose deacetylase (regulator of RNase III)
MLKRKCFVIMPFGEKKDPSGAVIDFDDIYDFMIRGAIEDELEMDCIRCDKIAEPGLIHRDMIREIFEADVAIVDITTTNANVFYELGVRHALRKGVTVVIRRKGTDIPFNIRDLRVLDYDPSKVMSLVRAKETIAEFVRAGLQSAKVDSIVHEYLDLRVVAPPSPIRETKHHLFSVKDVPGKVVGLTTGDIRNVNMIDIWVNSENTNMQMARFYDGSISGVIRFLAGTKNKVNEVVTDTVADELKAAMAESNAKVVSAHTVIPTSSGELRESNRVQRIFHVAAVQGVVGTGYVPVANFEECVRQALALADRDPLSEKCSSILFPLIGTGTGKADVEQSFRKMLATAIAYLKGKNDSRMNRVHFLVWTEAERRTCLGVIGQSADLAATIA